VNVAPHPPSPLPRPLPPRPPSPSAAPFRSQLSSNPALCPLCLSGKTLSDLHGSPVASHKSRRFMRLRALQLSCLSFSCPRPLFSIVCGLFFKNTGGWGCLAYSSVYRSGSVSLRLGLHPPGWGGKPPLVRSVFSVALWQSLWSDSHNFGAPITTFRINTCISVASKQLYLPLESTLTKKPGEGEGGTLRHLRGLLRREGLAYTFIWR
jgi:hypothetical protein